MSKAMFDLCAEILNFQLDSFGRRVKALVEESEHDKHPWPPDEKCQVCRKAMDRFAKINSHSILYDWQTTVQIYQRKCDEDYLALFEQSDASGI